MDAKIKAQELYNKIWYEFPAQTAVHFDLKPFVKQCALIAVELVIGAINDMEDPTQFVNGEWSDAAMIWEKVKEEIKQL